MNSLLIPPCPNWYRSNIMICASDDTLIYGSGNKIVIISPKPLNEPADIDIIHNAHRDKICGVAINPKWNNSYKWIASIGLDNVVNIWDAETKEKLQSNEFNSINSTFIDIIFSSNDSVVCVTENAQIITWNIINNIFTSFKVPLSNHDLVTCASICPHDFYLLGLGLKNGTAAIDLRKNKIKWRVKKHHKKTYSMSWCPVPVNIFAIHPMKKQMSDESGRKSDTVINPETKTQNVVKKKANPWINLKHADDDEMPKEEPYNIKTDDNYDFLKECMALKSKILDKECSEEDNTLASFTIESDTTEGQEHDYLLAIAFQGGEITILRGSDGSVESSFHVDSKVTRNSKYHRSSDRWLTINWICPTLLLSSGSQGELLQWNLLKLTHNSNYWVPKSEVIHKYHKNDIFSIAGKTKIIVNFEEAIEVWKEIEDINIWTIGQERYLYYISLDASKEIILSYPTLGHCVFTISDCIVNPTRIALGMGDGVIRIWDLSLPHIQKISMQVVNTKQFSNKILSIAWHSTNESLLAYGMEDGRIGIVNTNALTKPAVYLPHNFKRPIHKLEWGPLNGDVNNLGLYSCTSCVIAIYDISKTDTDPRIFKLTTTTNFITNMGWKPDFSVLAVGTKSGQIQLLTSELELIGTLYHQVKSILTMAWHPQVTTEDVETSPKSSWLASTSPTDPTIFIYDLSSITAGNINNPERLVCKLKGHNKQIHKLAWSPHENGLLASISEDGRTNIWNVVKEEIIATFLNNLAESLLAGIWSPLDKNYVITAGRDSTIQIWNIHSHPAKTDSEINLERKKRNVQISSIKTAKPETEGELYPEKTKLKKNILTLTSHRQSNLQESIEDCKALFHMYNYKKHQEEDLDNKVLKLFGTNEEAHELLQLQYDNHRSKLKYSMAQHVSLWRGNISESIREAIATGHLTPWLISMAPMVSPKLWQEACEAYANKLQENPKSDPIEMASYYIASHNINKAINALCSKCLYKEALVLAKCRLTNNEEVIEDILQQWATYCIMTGRFAVSAQNFIALKKYDEAAKALYKLDSPSALELAIELAEKCKNTELKDAIHLRYKLFKEESALQVNQLVNKLDEIELVGDHQARGDTKHNDHMGHGSLFDTK